MSVITNRDRDCLGCKITSGLGLLGIGWYVGKQIKRTNSLPGKITLLGVTIAFTGLGAARIFDLYPFNKKMKANYLEE